MGVHRPPIRRLTIAAALTAAAIALAACGDDDDSSTTETSATGAAAPATTETAPQGSASSRLALDAEETEGALSFSRRALRASAGDVTIVLSNPSGNRLPHAVEIEGEGVEEESPTIQPGTETADVTANLRPGTYTFYCPIGDHRQQGMEGTLTVG
jgi:plastocyanin